MTTTRTYRCNLCRDGIRGWPNDLGQKDGFGVHFEPGGRAVFKAVRECENHICDQCAQSVHDEFRKVTPQ